MDPNCTTENLSFSLQWPDLCNASQGMVAFDVSGDVAVAAFELISISKATKRRMIKWKKL